VSERAKTDPSTQLCFKLGKLVRRVQQYYDRRLAPYGLTPSQFFVLDVLWTGDGLTVTELGERVALDASTLTGILDRMERGSLVERQTNPSDRRSLLIRLTDRARALEHEVLPIADELDTSLRTPFPVDDVAVFERVLDSLTDVMGDMPKEDD